MKAKRATLYSVLLFATFTLFLYAPYEMMISNLVDIEIPFVLFWWIPVLLFVVSCLGGILFGMLLPEKLCKWYKTVIFALALIVYLQGNFLSIDLGVANGRAVDWMKYWGRMLCNVVVLEIIFASLLFFSYKKYELLEKVMRYTSLLLTLMQLTSLIFIIVSNSEQVFKSNNEITIETDYGICESSSEEGSVVCFLLDMFDSDYFENVMALDPELLDGLDGFTFFDNYSGVYSTTSHSLPFLATGQMFYNEMDLTDWEEDIYEKTDKMYLDELTDAGYKFYIYGKFYRPSKLASKIENNQISQMYITDRMSFTKQMYKLVISKYFPDFVKPYVWLYGTEFRSFAGYTCGNSAYTSDNVDFKSRISNREFTVVDNEKQFHYIYLDGIHYPYYTDEDGDRVPNDSVEVYDTTKGMLKIVNQYLDGLKQSGNYDNTAIIITADHGYYWDGSLTAPLLLVKPANSKGKLRINSAPTSQVDFGPTILQLAGIENYSDYGYSVFDVKENVDRERLFYQYYLSESDSSNMYRMIEYRIDSDSTDTSSFHLTGREYTKDGECIDHKKYCLSCNGEDDEFGNDNLYYHKKNSKYPE